MTVYFAHAATGGPIKIGHSGQLEHRMSMLASWIPGGVEVLARIDGGPAREEALKWLTRPYRIQGEWLRSCADVWRLIIEAADTGDLPWLPHGDGPDRQAFLASLQAYFGSKQAAASALGIAPTGLPTGSALGPYVSAVAAGRFAAERAIRAGALPNFLLAAHPRPARQAEAA